jgi:prepilin-type N-terminal cleavage/methylation domain-containing protein
MAESNVGRHRRLLGLSRTMGHERGFTIVELGIVVAIMSVMLTAAVVSYYTATRTTEVQTVAEQIKEEIRRVYSMTDSGEKTSGTRNRYQITFNNNGESPANSYKVEKGTSADGGTTWSWGVVAPAKSTSNKIVSTDWVQPSSQSDCQLTYSAKTITFIPSGTLIMTNPPADNTVTVTSVSQGKSVVITTNSFGTVDSTL